ncbi:radical SAM/SPASM domain-containing protein [Tumebacillus flagellatus]|uniref:Radical SAM core domain-containing protein n=1 Tax=Tumebacillus flagellatus TaxID=1157490 RepID=A0A074LS65_9BACL|nr:radical SAM protein [Tumebacillus flagellatus]KEO83964.1 hypothetical protein EL26_07190 [Tumebacillus flagellatus]
MVQRSKTSERLDNVGDQFFVSSRFNVRTYDEEGNLLLYNSFNGQFVTIERSDAADVVNLLSKGSKEQNAPIVKELIERGFMIPHDVNEFMRANLQHKEALYKERKLNLILMPNEDCNFRCVYCYESFAKNKMDEATQRGIIEYVRRELDHYDSLNISWFGGEPLTALDIIVRLSQEMLQICREKKKLYSANMTTNGYLLDVPTFIRLMKVGVFFYQITFDGTSETHNRHRVLAHGGATFDQIYNNLIAIRDTSIKNFEIIIRSNVDEDVHPYMKKYIKMMVEDFGGDPRFRHHFVPIQKLGGNNDTNIHLCDTKDILPLVEQAQGQGLDFSLYRELIQPFGSVCYAAKPTSFCIGSDGMVYKCTVAFDDERNHVGQLYEDGTMELYYDRFALWVVNGALEDTACQKCYFRPSCQGEACPLERIEHGKQPCPPIKKNIKAYLKILAAEKNHQHLIFSSTR